MHATRRIRLALFAVAVLLTPLLGHAAFEPLELEEATRLIEEIGGLEEYPDANAIVGLDETEVRFDETGSYVEWSHTLMKILTDEGRDRYGSIPIVYHRRYGTVEIVAARVVKADGTEIPVTEDLITDDTPTQISAMDIYETDFRQRTVVFPGLEPGDAIEFVIRQDYEPLIENGFNGVYFLQHIEPIASARVTVTGPSEMPLYHVVKGGDVDFTEESRGGTTTYIWSTSNTEMIERELAMAPMRQIATRVVVSTMETWEEASRYMWDMVDEKCVAEDSVKELVAELTDGLSTTEEKIRAIHYWITENVRYLGIAMDRGVFLEPHFAAYTLEKEYGVCRDKAVLMVTMLGEIGVPAWVVAINPSHRMDSEIPTLYFEHGIVAIKGPDGDYLYIDPTIEESREVYAAYAGDRHVLVLTEEGSDLRKVKHVPASDNSGEITDRAVLDEEGGIEGAVTISGRGFYELILRTMSKNLGEPQLKMRAEEMVQSVYPGAALTDFAVTDPDDLYVPTSITLAYDIADYVLDAGPYRLFRVPAATGAFEILSDFLFGEMVGLPERKYPVALGVTLGVEENAEVVIPDGYVVENLPDAVEFEEGIVSLSMTYEYVPPSPDEDALVRYTRTFGIDSFEISPEDYLSLKEAVRLAARSEKGEVILKREEG